MTASPIARLAVLATALGLGACASTSVVDDWDSGHRVAQPPDKVAVFVGASEDLTRQAYEQVIAGDLQKAGIDAVPSVRIRGLRGNPDREDAEKALSAANVDGVIAVFIIAAVQGEVYERSDYYATQVGSGVVGGWGAYNWWGPPQFVNVYEVREGPGAFNVSEDLYLESNYYDFRDQAPVWRMVTETKDVANHDAAKAVSKEIVAQMRRRSLLP